ncbi:MAG: VWA domain-containing protein, partial [Verrucomicrobiales bacterium]|nr:VWA domain-containing protein [Verrucomicrobiales bacterium]
MTFAHPILVWAAVACVPVLALFFVWSWRTRRRLIAEFVPRRLQAALTLGHSPRRARTRALLLLLGTVFLMLALARPRLGATSIEVTQRGLDILVALDTSKSMLAEDAGPGISRLRRAKLAALDLARLARTDRVGLIAFAGTAFLQCPLTIDDDAFRQSVEALDVDIIPEGGTSFGPAIRTALEAHAAESRNVRVLVLFTDGEDHESSALAEAEAAKEKGLRIFTVGVGTTRGEIIRIRDSQGNPAYLKDSKGNVVKSALNESLLTEISQRTGGFYLPLQGPQVIEELFHRGLEPLPRSDLQARTIEQYDERFQIPLLLALLLLAVESLLPERARPKGAVRELPVGHPTLAQAVQSVTTLILGIWIALALLSSRASASPGSAWEDYENGRFDQALHEFERLAREHPEDPRYQFNAGAAAFRSADFERASRHFSNTLHTPDLELQRHAYYNLGNTLFSQGEGIEDMNARRGLWESSIKSLDAAMRLAPDNPNTRHNLDYVRTRLEDLKQQQQQQQKQNQKDKQEQKDPKQDENQQKQDSQDPSQDQQKQDSSEPQDSQDNQPSDPQQSEPKDSESQAPESGNQDPQKDQNSGSPK